MDEQKRDNAGERQNTTRTNDESEQYKATKAPNDAIEGSILEDDPGRKEGRTRSGGEASGE